ncbi:MAG: hypothetical protein ACRCVT_10910, partial [Leadbetterella sp.]
AKAKDWTIVYYEEFETKENALKKRKRNQILEKQTQNIGTYKSRIEHPDCGRGSLGRGRV